MRNKITFNNADKVLMYNKKSKLKQQINLLFMEEGVQLESLTYIFCSDNFLLNINSEFLQHHYFTDIITFSLADAKQPVIGEAYISIDRVKDNAEQFHSTFKQELERVVIHGALHLCGYSDKTKKQIAIIRAKEDYYLKKLHGNHSF